VVVALMVVMVVAVELVVVEQAPEEQDMMTDRLIYTMAVDLVIHGVPLIVLLMVAVVVEVATVVVVLRGAPVAAALDKVIRMATPVQTV
jgi:hypothetical protein